VVVHGVENWSRIQALFITLSTSAPSAHPPPSFCSLPSIYCRWRGAHLTMSSTRMIISAASVADRRICCLTRKLSKMPFLAMHPTVPSSTSMPIVLPGVAWHARSCRTAHRRRDESQPNGIERHQAHATGLPMRHTTKPISLVPSATHGSLQGGGAHLRHQLRRVQPSVV
jgi:hypothetical protein